MKKTLAGFLAAFLAAIGFANVAPPFHAPAAAVHNVGHVAFQTFPDVCDPASPYYNAEACSNEIHRG